MPVTVKVDTAMRQAAQSPAPLLDYQSTFFIADGNDSDRDIENLTALPDIDDDSSSQKDLVTLPELKKLETAKSQRDPKLVTWSGDDDPENPKNWTTKQKWAAVFVVPCFTLISPVASSMLAPALAALGKDLHIDNSIVLEMTLSVFVLAYAIGPLFFGPLSEIYGRARVLLCANLGYLVFNTACGFCNSKGQMILFRLLAGIGGSAPLSVGGGVMSDCFRAEERGKAMAIYSLGPLLGPAIGPVAGGFIAEYSTWRWCLWGTSIVALFIQVAGFFLLKETYAPTLLHRKAKKLRKETGDDEWHTEFERPKRSLTSTLSVSLRRPFILIATQPIVQALAIFMAYVYGLMYLLLASFPDLWTDPDYYGESVATGGLNYFSLAVGFFIGAQFSAQLNDRFYKKLVAGNNGVGLPEFRTPLLFIGALLLPVGILIYGWTAEKRVHWIAPNIGVVILCMATIMSFQCIQVYLVDTYTRYAASAMAAAVLLRSLAGFGFPLFAPYLFKKLHYGWGNSVLALVALVLGVPAPLLLWKFGAKLRSMSTYAAG